MNQNRLRKLLILGVLLVVGYYASTILLTSSVEVTLSNDISTANTSVLIDDKRATPIGTNGKTFRASVGLGKHTVKVSSSGFKEYSTRVSTSIRSTKTVGVTLEPETADIIADRLYPDATIVNPQYFGNQNWVVFRAEGQEGSIVIAKFNESAGKWEVVEEGTDINPREKAFSDAPDELINYMGQL